MLDSRVDTLPGQADLGSIFEMTAETAATLRDRLAKAGVGGAVGGMGDKLETGHGKLEILGRLGLPLGHRGHLRRLNESLADFDGRKGLEIAPARHGERPAAHLHQSKSWKSGSRRGRSIHSGSKRAYLKSSQARPTQERP